MLAARAAGAALAALLVDQVTGFNYDVHNQIGFMAEQHLTSEARWMVEQVLEPEYKGSIGRAGSWADTVRCQISRTARHCMNLIHKPDPK